MYRKSINQSTKSLDNTYRSINQLLKLSVYLVVEYIPVPEDGYTDGVPAPADILPVSGLSVPLLTGPNQSINQSINQSVDQLVNQST